MDYFALFELILNIFCLDWLDLAPKRPGGAIFLTSKVSFTDQKFGYRVIVITVIYSRVFRSGAFVNVHIATSLTIYTCVKSIKFARDALLNDDICLATVI